MADSAELPAGTDLGPYRIVRCIATGGMGAVYEAEHRELRKRVAIKTPFTEAGLSPEGRARFVQEGKTASRLRHPHVVDITDVGEVDDVAYLVMEYLEGEPFSSRIGREGPLPPDVIADTLIPVAAALHEAHAMGIIHRDLKPDNIFLTRSVQGNIHPKILDFGISKVLGDESPRLTSTSNVMLGTPNYLSPEQLESPHAITAKSDQYSLGVVIYEAATGDNPFSGHNSLMSILRAIEKGDYPLPRDVNGQIDERLEQVALRAMSVSADARYPSMAALAAELLPLASPATQNAWAGYFAQHSPGSGSRGAASGKPPAPPRSESRGVWLLAAASLAALAIGASAFLASAPAEPTVDALARPLAASIAQPPSPSGPRPQAASRESAGESPSVPPPSSDVAPGDLRAAPGDRLDPLPSPRASAPAEPAPAEPAPSTGPDRPQRTSKRDISRASNAKVRYVREPRARPAGAKSVERAPARERTRAARDRPELERSSAEAARDSDRAPAGRAAEPLKTDNLDPWDTRTH